MAATIGAIGSLIGGVAAAGSALTRGQGQQQQQYGLQAAQLQDARNNEAFQRALAVLVNQRSVAGSQDSFGSTLRYDPATNSWVSDLGALPKAAQTAAYQAGVSRDTTDLRNAQFANEQAMKRSAAATPGYDSALRALMNFRQQSPDELAAAQTGQAVTANNAVMRPIIADTLRNFTRTGTGTGAVMGELGRQSYTNLRDALVSGRISALQNTAQINNQNRSGLEGSVGTFAGLANPSLQYSGIQSNDPNATMASLLADRAKTASTAPAMGAYGVNQATALGQSSTDQLSKNLPDPNFRTNQLGAAGKDISNMLGDKNVQDLFSRGWNSLFGKGSSSSNTDSQSDAWVP